jgi:hypothetical protein
MSQINVPASTLHKAIAALAEYLEDGVCVANVQKTTLS